MVSEAHRLLHMRGPRTNELLNMWVHSRVFLPKQATLEIMGACMRSCETDTVSNCPSVS